MRIVLVMGKGGVGKTTFSAATALRAATRGPGRVLVASTDAAHSLAEALGTEVGCEPTEVAPNLDAVQLDGRHELQRSWSTISDYLAELLDVVDLDRLHTAELLVLPGLDQLLALARLRDFASEGTWRGLVVDCAPSADSLRLLSLPDVLDWYLTRIFGRSGMIRSRVRRNIERTLSITSPSDRVLTSVSDLTSQLSGFRSTLEQAVTTARIVVTPEHLVVAEGQRTMSYLALYGYPVDAVLINRVLAADPGSPLLEAWHANQTQQLKRIDEAFSPLPQVHAQIRPCEPIGLEDLAEVGLELYGDQDPLRRMSTLGAVTISSEGTDAFVRIPVSGIERGDISVEREGAELTIGLGAHRRVIALPDAFADQQVLRAGVNHDMLEVVFTGADHA
jgi:arsenite/tail-anchored protein-transporting ATPase